MLGVRHHALCSNSDSGLARRLIGVLVLNFIGWVSGVSTCCQDELYLPGKA